MRAEFGALPAVGLDYSSVDDAVSDPRAGVPAR
jgi:hypothetical protein